MYKGLLIACPRNPKDKKNIILLFLIISNLYAFVQGCPLPDSVGGGQVVIWPTISRFALFCVVSRHFMSWVGHVMIIDQLQSIAKVAIIVRSWLNWPTMRRIASYQVLSWSSNDTWPSTICSLICHIFYDFVELTNYALFHDLSRHFTFCVGQVMILDQLQLVA